MSVDVGESVGRYRLTGWLGQGGMATVYRAFDPENQSDVAIKFIRTDRLAADSARRTARRFRLEARHMARLAHPHIVKVIEAGEHGGVPYMVMQYVPGATLKQRLGAPLAWREAAGLLAPVAQALAYAHANGIVHRDVKPGNILLTKTGYPILTDFGIAKVLEASEDTTVDSSLTATGATAGTPDYMAPEQAHGRGVDHRTDIYALGVIFYELVTGRKPFTATTSFEVLVQHVSAPLPPPRKFVPDLPRSVERVIVKALAKQPDQRYQTMAEFAAALTGLLQVPRPASLFTGRPRPLLIAAGGLIGLLVAGGAFAAYSSGIVLGPATSTVTPTVGQSATRAVTPTPSLTLTIPPSLTVAVLPTAAPSETATETPTVPPTATETQVTVPTQPPATSTPRPTAVVLPPTATSPPVVVPQPTSTQAPLPPATDTSAPPPLTDTSAPPPPTDTSAPPPP